MFEKKMNFIQPDLHVFYFNDALESRSKRDDSNYYIFILLNGSCKIKYHDKIYIAKPNDVHIANIKETFSVEFNNTHAEFIQIYFSSKYFREFDRNYDLLKPFTNKSMIKILNSEVNTPEFSIALKNLIRALQQHSSRAFVMTAVLQILCELNYIYEKKQPFEIKETDSTYAKIISYIDNHLFEKITLDSISQNVFLSKKSICENIKKINGVTYLELINRRRLFEAKKLIYATQDSLKAIAERCGFETYSTFYRRYLKHYKITPKQELEKKANGHKFP